MGMWEVFTEVAHIVIPVIILIEGIFFYLRLRAEIKKKAIEKKSQEVADVWRNDLAIKIAELRKIGDLTYKEGNEPATDEIKRLIEDLNYILYSLRLFATENPIIMARALAFLKDRKDDIDKAALEFFKIKLKAFKGKKYKSIKKEVDEILLAIESSKKGKS